MDTDKLLVHVKCPSCELDRVATQAEMFGRRLSKTEATPWTCTTCGHEGFAPPIDLETAFWEMVIPVRYGDAEEVGA